MQLFIFLQSLTDIEYTNAELTGGIKISRGQKSAIFTLNEFSALENEICNFADYRIHCIVEGSD